MVNNQENGFEFHKILGLDLPNQPLGIANGINTLVSLYSQTAMLVAFAMKLDEFKQMPSVLSITHGLVYNDDTKYSIRIGISEDISEKDLNKILDFKNDIQADTDRCIIDIFSEKKNTDCGGLSKIVFMCGSSMLFNPPNQE